MSETKPECECLTWACTCGTEIICREHERYLLAPKPDATPREFWLHEWIDSGPDGFLSGNIKSEPAYDVFIEPTPDTIHVLEKSAYDERCAQAERSRLLWQECQAERDALKARVAELEFRNQKDVTINEGLHQELAAARQEIEQINQEGAELYIEIRKERDAANETIKALRHEMRMQGSAVKERDSLSSQLFWANDVIDALKKKAEHVETLSRGQLTELVAARRDHDQDILNLADANAEIERLQKIICSQPHTQLHKAQEREQKLVSALEDVLNHPCDCPNEHRRDVEAALKEHKGEA